MTESRPDGETNKAFSKNVIQNYTLEVLQNIINRNLSTAYFLKTYEFNLYSGIGKQSNDEEEKATKE